MTEPVREYVLGLSLYALLSPIDLDLRADCNLIVTKTEVSVVNGDGTREALAMTFEDAKAFAKSAADKFGIEPALTFTYDEGKALKLLNKKAAAAETAAVAKEEKKNNKAAKAGK